MSSTISRFIVADPTLYLKPNRQLLLFNRISHTPFSKNKEFAWKFYDKSWNMQTTTFVRQSSVNPPPEPPIPSGSSPSGSLRNWIVGLVLTFILPFFTHKWGSWLQLKNKVEKNIETTEHVVKAIENVADRVDKVIDSITDDLPNDSKLKKALERVDELAEGVAKSAHVADDIIIKVEEAEDKLESLIIHQEKFSKVNENPQKDEDKEDQDSRRN